MYPVIHFSFFSGAFQDRLNDKLKHLFNDTAGKLQNLIINRKRQFMGRMKNGILGPLRGKIGTVIGRIWNGIPYVRSKPVGTKKKGSPAQLADWAKFAKSLEFTQSMTTLVKVTFKNSAIRKSGFNCAHGYTKKNAMRGEYPDYTID